MLLADGGDKVKGKFLIRAKDDSGLKFVVSVIYKGAPTHHNLVRSAVGEELKLNKVGTGCTTLPQMIEKYKAKQPKWPVPFTEGVANGDAGDGDGDEEPQDAADGPGEASTGAPEPEFGAVVETDDPMTEWFHGPLSKNIAEELLLADDGAKKKGKFLVRAKKTGTDVLILSVIYKGKPSHHALARKKEGEPFSLNKNDTGLSSLAEVLTWLREKRPKWPVALSDGVPNGKPKKTITISLAKSPSAGADAKDAPTTVVDSAPAAEPAKAAVVSPPYEASDDEAPAAPEPIIVTRHEIAAKTAQWPPRRPLSAELDAGRKRVVPTRKTYKIEQNALSPEQQKSKREAMSAQMNSNFSAFAGFEDLYSTSDTDEPQQRKRAPKPTGKLLEQDVFQGFKALTLAAATNANANSDDDFSDDDFGFTE